MSTAEANKRDTHNKTSFFGFDMAAKSGLQSAKSFYDHMYKKELSSTEYCELNFNLVRYIEVLIVLDKQYQEWIKTQNHSKS